MLKIENIETMGNVIADKVNKVFKVREAFGLTNELYIVHNSKDFDKVKFNKGVFISSVDFENMGEDIRCDYIGGADWWFCRHDDDDYIISILQQFDNDGDLYDKFWCENALNLSDAFLIKTDGTISKKRVPVDINKADLSAFVCNLSLNGINRPNPVADGLFFHYITTADYEFLSYGQDRGHLFNKTIMDKHKPIFEKWLAEKSNYEPWIEDLVLICMYEALDPSDKITVRLMLGSSKHWKMFKQAQLLVV